MAPRQGAKHPVPGVAGQAPQALDPRVLRCPSPPRWLPRALGDLDTLLLDHAHCEKKAASTVLGFSFRVPEMDFAGQMSRLAREELTHFEMALRELRRRNLPFTKQNPSAYAEKLMVGVRRKVLDDAMVDSLVIAALIEARSHERLVLLEAAVDGPHLKAFYAALVESEERHAAQLLGLAERWGDPEPRLAEFSSREAEIITAGEEAVRMHS